MDGLQCFYDSDAATYLLTRRNSEDAFLDPELFRHVCEFHMWAYLAEIARSEDSFCLLSIIKLA